MVSALDTRTCKSVIENIMDVHTTALMTVILNPAWVANVEKAMPILSPVLIYPNMMTQNEKKVRTVVFIFVMTSMNTVTPKDPNISNGNSFTKNEK